MRVRFLCFFLVLILMACQGGEVLPESGLMGSFSEKEFFKFSDLASKSFVEMAKENYTGLGFNETVYSGEGQVRAFLNYSERKFQFVDCLEVYGVSDGSAYQFLAIIANNEIRLSDLDDLANVSEVLYVIIPINISGPLSGLIVSYETGTFAIQTRQSSVWVGDNGTLNVQFEDAEASYYTFRYDPLVNENLSELSEQRFSFSGSFKCE